ncbi:hypothetical protein Tco_0064718 [Tanacetum coccineum]
MRSLLDREREEREGEGEGESGRGRLEAREREEEVRERGRGRERRGEREREREIEGMNRGRERRGGRREGEGLRGEREGGRRGRAGWGREREEGREGEKCRGRGGRERREGERREGLDEGLRKAVEIELGEDLGSGVTMGTLGLGLGDIETEGRVDRERSNGKRELKRGRSVGRRDRMEETEALESVRLEMDEDDKIANLVDLHMCKKLPDSAVLSDPFQRDPTNVNQEIRLAELPIRIWKDFMISNLAKSYVKVGDRTLAEREASLLKEIEDRVIPPSDEVITIVDHTIADELKDEIEKRDKKEIL